ncbi:MAG: hypothetical protein IKR39_11880 [Lachnospiraceae bacterium]|nr:hypothetical protein [Lachnospiraceae bacterium]
MKKSVLGFILYLAIVFVILLIALSFKKTKTATPERYFQVEDVFTITLDETQYTVVTGYSVGGTIYVDDTLVLTTAGERTETKVVSFETMQGEHPTSAAENENIAVWLDQYLSQTIKSGDKLVDATAIK